MTVQSTLIPTTTQADLYQPPDTSLQGHWRLVVQVACAAISGLAILIFLISIPIDFALWRTVCVSDSCISNQISPVGMQALGDFGLSVSFYALYLTGLNVTMATVFTVSGLVIVIRKADDWLALFVAVMLIAFGTITFSDTRAGLIATYPRLWLPAQSIAWFGDVAIMLFFFIFPTGQFVPRWTRFVFALWAIMQGLRLFLPETGFNLQHSARPLYDILFPAGLISGMVAQLYRYRRIASPAQQQQTKWVVFSVIVSLAGILLAKLPFQGFQSEEYLPLLLALGTVQVFFILLIPISIAVAVVRYRLWEIDPIINRTLVYGALTVSVIGFYVIIVGTFGSMFQVRGNFVISVLATGIAAFVFEPLRKRLQRTVNRLMYGERDDPYAAISRLSQRLESTLAPEVVLPTIVETVAQALKLPLVEAVVQDKVTRWQGDKVTASSVASSLVTPSPLHLVTLSYQGEPVGELRLAPRAPGESFSPADRQLLHDLAQQAGIAIHALRLTLDLHRLNADLQRSREELVTAREEERRRLRRDLHDGLGPQLASQALKLEALHDLIRTRPARAEALVDELIAKSQETIADVRRVVYALRPPALDQFGLLGAIREYARQCETDSTRITVNAPEQLPPLSAAVEVATYRIIQEALTNVLRHAQAQHAEVSIDLSEGETTLQITICDDGSGLPPTHHPGVGLHSMGERAAELGGECWVAAQSEGGTRVYAQLPLNPREF